MPLVFQYVDLELIFLSGCPNNGVRRRNLHYSFLRKPCIERYRIKVEVIYMLPESQKKIGIQMIKKRT